MSNLNFELDTPLFHFSSDPDSAAFTMGDSVEGVQIFGGIGSGKTTGSGALIAKRYLRAGYGGLVLTAKTDELELWQKYCAETGRTDDLIIVEPGRTNYFNFLQYETSGRKDVSYTENILQVLKTVIKAAEQRSKGKSDDQFWETALDLFMTNIISLCLVAYNNIDVQLLYDVAQSAPRNKQTKQQKPEDKAKVKPTPFLLAVRDARMKVKQQRDEFKIKYPPHKLVDLSKEAYNELLNAEVPDFRTLKIIDEFFMEGLFAIGEKTRAIIDFCFTGFLFRLLRDPIYSLFCSHASTFTPEDCFDGKIIILNLPVKTYDKAGQDAQVLFKYIWQRAMERRTITDNSRIVFLWSDESQFFLHENDPVYQATARSSRIATVYITQNISNYHASMQSDQAAPKVKSFLGTLATKIFHANADIDTNKYGSELMGKNFFPKTSHTFQYSDGAEFSESTQDELYDYVRPEEFLYLKTGGKENNYKVQAYIVMQGKKLKHGLTFQKICFNQKSI